MTQVTGLWTIKKEMLTIDIHKDFWGCLGWQFLDGDGEIIVEDYYNGEATYTHEVCVRGCYTIAAQTVRRLRMIDFTMTAS